MPTHTQGSQLAPTSTVTDGTRSFPPTPKSVVLCSSRELTKNQKRAVNWDREVRRRAEDEALRLAEGDPIRAIIYRAAILYRRSFDVATADFVDYDGEFWLVGRNATHQFYLGFDTLGAFARASGGEDVICEEDPEWSMSEWMSWRDSVNAFHRRNPEFRSARDTAWLEVDNGRIRHCYEGHSFRVTRISDPNNIGYLGHY